MRAALVLLSLFCFVPLSVLSVRAENGIPFADAHTHLFRGSEGAGGGLKGGRVARRADDGALCARRRPQAGMDRDATEVSGPLCGWQRPVLLRSGEHSDASGARIRRFAPGRHRSSNRFGERQIHLSSSHRAALMPKQGVTVAFSERMLQRCWRESEASELAAQGHEGRTESRCHGRGRGKLPSISAPQPGDTGFPAALRPTDQPRK
jgi:hypothetical protein